MALVAAPTVEQILNSELHAFAPVWATATPEKPQPDLVPQIYIMLRVKRFDPKKVMVLEFSCYLEHYLLPFLKADSPKEHVLSIVLLVNEKFRENVPAWEAFSTHAEKFPDFFLSVLKLRSDPDLTFLEKVQWLQFLINCFQSLEQDFVRASCLKVTNVQSWFHLNTPHRNSLLAKSDKLRKVWKAVAKRYATPKTDWMELEKNFLAGLLEDFLELLATMGAPDAGEELKEGEATKPRAVTKDQRQYCERFLELLIDLVNQLPTRRFFCPLLTDKHFVVRCRMSAFAQHEDARLFNQLLEILRFYERFEIDESSGNALSAQAVTDKHYSRHDLLQRVCFQDENLRDIAVGHVSKMDTRDALAERLKTVSLDALKHLCENVCFLTVDSDPVLAKMMAQVTSEREAAGEPMKKKRKKLLPSEKEAKRILSEIFTSHLERRVSQMEEINRMPLMPTEDIIWDPNLVPAEHFMSDFSLALPKLNLQFLTIHDYLLRNFTLFRLESTYEIREDMQDALQRMKPMPADGGGARFLGHARMAMPLTGYSTSVVKKPRVGETVPADVLGELHFSVQGLLPIVKREWDQLREHDVLFLMSVTPPDLPEGERFDPAFLDQLPVEQWPNVLGIQSVRGAEVIEMLDEEGNNMSEGRPDQRNDPVGDGRTVRVRLDAAQYQIDMDNGDSEKYSNFNLVLRRKPKENNFKAVLETIRSLMNSQDTVVPAWIHDLFLGYGDPGSAQYFKMDTMLTEMDWRDTFLDRDHLLASFADADEIEIPDGLQPPFKLKFTKVDEENGKPVEKITVTSYSLPNMGPYPRCQPRLNAIRFTETQVRAIRSGSNMGLTMIVGPPGTGKTDTAVQTVNLLYHNFPEEKILLVAHSNQALNDLFQKIVQLDISEHYLLRLGRGSEELGLDIDYSKWGRVNHMLQRRLELLKEVEKLAASLGLAESKDIAYSCDTAQHFFLLHVQSRWEKYNKDLRVAGEDGAKLDQVYKGEIDVSKRSAAAVLFPFHTFFADAPQPLFPSATGADDAEIARGCWRYIEKLFKDVEECHAFELLRNMHDRCSYLVTKHSRIIAMTCTHAALQRKNLVNLAFRYDSLIMEEAAQVLEVETLIPMLLQQPERGVSRLKRVVLIGDHHQLPPVIKNHAIQKYGRLDQSMFARFVRLRVPTIDLNLQGRARPSIACLYNWRYRDLGDLQAVLQGSEYIKSNPALTYDYQFIDVPDFQGKGESQPSPYYYQNLGEAEYVVALFMYMRLKGYPANKISILSTYNGQKHLIRDVLRQRCAWNPLFGEPRTVTTVDRFQGQQNDYILISLVRTQNVGHIRDVRRLVVACSRARLGMYFFGRLALFQNCFEIAPTFRLLAERPSQMSLELGETFPQTPRAVGQAGTPTVVRDLEHMWSLLQTVMQQTFLEASAEAAEQAGVGATGDDDDNE